MINEHRMDKMNSKHVCPSVKQKPEPPCACEVWEYASKHTTGIRSIGHLAKFITHRTTTNGQLTFWLFRKPLTPYTVRSLQNVNCLLVVVRCVMDLAKRSNDPLA